MLERIGFRVIPTIYVVDESDNVLLTCGTEAAIPDAIRTAFRELLLEKQRPESDRVPFRVVGASSVVRIAPASGALGNCTVIMVEPFHSRDYLRYSAEHYALTRREQEVVRLLIEGKETQEIAKQLSITRNTVNLYIKSALAKTGCRSRTALLGTLMMPGPNVKPNGNGAKSNGNGVKSNGNGLTPSRS
jgi:DNA-binding CsgD family transcriptional regulator